MAFFKLCVEISAIQAKIMHMGNVIQESSEIFLGLYNYKIQLNEKSVARAARILIIYKLYLAGNFEPAVASPF